MSTTKTYANVLLPLAAPGSYTYALPKGVLGEDLIGRRVLVYFGQGNKLYTGIILSLSQDHPEFQVKEIIEFIDDTTFIHSRALQLWKWIADYYMCHMGEVMNSALPGILNLSSESLFALNNDSNESLEGLSTNERSIINSLDLGRGVNLKDISNQTGLKNPLPIVKKLMEKDLVRMKEEVVNSYKVKTHSWIGLSNDVLNSDDFETIVLGLRRAPKQLKMLMTLIELNEWDGESESVNFIRKDELLQICNGNDATLKSLVNKGIFTIEKREESRVDHDVKKNEELKELNKHQKESMKSIDEIFEQKDVVLLHGVTSSGKTEIYAHMIQRAISQGKQVLYLLPEISLTSQLINRLKKYFGNRIAVFHSRISQNERAEVWHRLSANKQDDIQIVMGARSALFLPFQDLGLIIVDEEHDRSFKQQDPAPRYEARDSAIVLAKLHGAKVILGSATPSLESIENAGSGKYGYVELKKRHGGIEMPEMLAVDLSEERRKRKMKASFSSVLFHEIKDTLDAGEQIILFQNRRGYAPFLLCNHCAHTPTCKNCDVSLTYHKKRNYLICHYCGYSIQLQINCQECKLGKLEEVGIGTQRIEEELGDLFPNTKVARLDMDSTRKKNAFQILLDDFENKEIDILVGTQMVTKGLDFENVGLVGVINADSMLRFPDFRSFERTYQMLTQVAGRAGRKKKQGKVIIQTYDPYHPVIQFVLSNNYKEFVKSEMRERKMFNYPPFYRILDVRIKHRDREVLYHASKELGAMLKKVFGQQLLGPEFPYIERIRNLYSMQLILKISKHTSISAVKKKLNHTLADFSSKDNFKSIKIQVDVDPY